MNKCTSKKDGRRITHRVGEDLLDEQQRRIEKTSTEMNLSFPAHNISSISTSAASLTTNRRYHPLHHVKGFFFLPGKREQA